MTATCPYCRKNLNDLNFVMDELAKDKINGEYYFQSPCCDQKIRAYSESMTYYIVAADPLPDPEMIGAA